MAVKTQLIHQVMELRQPKEAMARLLSMYDLPTKVSTAYAMFNSVVCAITRNSRYVNPSYRLHVETLMQTWRDHPEWSKIQELLDKTPLQQHRIFTDVKYQYVSDPEFMAAIRRVPPFQQPLYDFKDAFPAELKARHYEEERERNMRRVSHMRQGPADIEKDLNTAITVVQEPITSWASFWRTVTAIQIFTGRRKMEVARDAIFSATNHLYQIRVEGLAKKKDEENANGVFPTLYPVTAIIRVIDSIRAFTAEKGEVGNMNSDSVKASKKVWGREMKHTDIRSMYLELAWRRRRSENHFMMDAPRGIFDTGALGHAQTYTRTMHYQNTEYV